MQNGGSGAEAADRAFLSSVERQSPQPSKVVLNQVMSLVMNQVMSSLDAGYNGGKEVIDALSYRVVLSIIWRGRSNNGDYNCAWDEINVWKKEGDLSRGFPPYDSVGDQKTKVTDKEREEKRTSAFKKRGAKKRKKGKTLFLALFVHRWSAAHSSGASHRLRCAVDPLEAKKNR